MDVHVQVCGRREKVSVSHVAVRELVTAVGREFEVKPPFLFAAHDGRMLPDDHALAEYVRTGDTVVVKLTEGVMHDFSRRMDQLRHLQWGFLSDQLAHAKQDSGGKKDISSFKGQLLQEQANREAGEAELRRGLEAVQDTLRKERVARDALLQTVEDKIADLELRIDKSAQPHEAAATSLQQGITELARSIGDERRHREHGEAMLRQERQELQAELRSEVASVQENSARLRKEVAQTQASVEVVQAAWRSECLELRQGFSDMRQALAAEQQERAASEGRSTSAVHQAQRLVAQDSKDRSAAMQALETSVRSLETSLESAKAEIKRVRREQEDVSQRVPHTRDTQDLSTQMELLRRTVDNESHERKQVSGSVDRLWTDVEQRLADESKARQIEVEKLLRMVSAARISGHEPDLVKSSSFTSGGDSPQATRALRDMQQDLVATKSELKSIVDAALREVRAGGGSSFRDSSEGWSTAVQKLREDCKEAMQREVRSRVEREKALREELEKRVRELREGLEKHTHELHVEGLGVNTTVTTGGASVPFSYRPPSSRSPVPSAPSASGSNLGGSANMRPSLSPTGGTPTSTMGKTVFLNDPGSGGDMVRRSQTSRPSALSRGKTMEGPEVSRSGTYSSGLSTGDRTSRSMPGNMQDYEHT